MRKLFGMLLTLVLILAGILTYTRSCQAQYITEEQAKAAVRTFEGDNNLEFKRISFDEYTSGPEWSNHWWYDLDNADPNAPWSWMVDAVSAEVTGATYMNRIPDSPADDPFGSFTQEQCRVIAENFARAKYVNFDNMGFSLDTPRWNGTGWRFNWSQIVAYGAGTPNGVTIEVNPTDGSIQVYDADRVSTCTPRQPQLSAQDALDIAIQAGGIVTLEWNSSPSLFTTPDGDVSWSFAFGGLDAQEDYKGFYIDINAETGEILEKAAENFRMPPMSGPKALISIKKLLPREKSSAIERLGKNKLKLTLDKKTYLLTVGSDHAEYGDKKIKLPQTVKLVKGEFMVTRNLFYLLKRASKESHKMPLPKIQLPTPTFNPEGGTLKADRKIAISCAVKKATIRYTTDGTDPTESSAEYTAPVAISQSCTLKAKAFKSGWTASDIKSAAYTIE
jgi:hypothetical protein